MASLVEELKAVLTEECSIYEQLIPIEREKTKIIVKNELEALSRITEVETEWVQKITDLERKRQEILQNIGIVMNQRNKQLKMKDVIELLGKQPEEQKELSILHDRLRTIIPQLVAANNQNKSLIKQSLEMVEFNMNFIQSTRMSPGNNNYTKGATSMGTYDSQTWMFDAKQ